jgi:hypothetical protein
MLLPMPVAKLSVLMHCNSTAVTESGAALSLRKLLVEGTISVYHPVVRVDVTVREAPDPR